MRKFIPALVLLIVIISSCQKSSTAAAKPVSAIVETPKPAASTLPKAFFTVANTITIDGNDKNVREGTPLLIQNTSENGASYLWDFGTGETSTAETPDSAYLYPCMNNHTITLTVTNKDGVSATYSQTFYVQCYKGVPNGRIAGTMPPGWQSH